jgi:hypothetical protein
VSERPQLSEEMIAGPARIRIDVIGGPLRDHVLDDMSFLNYRLADVQLAAGVSLPEPDLVWHCDGKKAVTFDGRRMVFTGDWPAGPIQKAIVSLLALRLESRGLHPFHASAVRYRDRTILFLGGESNHGKTMGQLEACRRGARLVSTETTVIDEAGQAVMGSKQPFVKRRAEGTERADKAAPEAGVAKFFGDMPSWELEPLPSNVDVVVLPAIDGNFAPSMVEMIPFEREFQTLHSLQNYFLLNELLAPGIAMPLLDTTELRRARAAFIHAFCARPYFFVRAATPQVLLDEVDRVI